MFKTRIFTFAAIGMILMTVLLASLAFVALAK